MLAKEWQIATPEQAAYPVPVEEKVLNRMGLSISDIKVGDSFRIADGDTDVIRGLITHVGVSGVYFMPAVFVRND